MIGFTIMKKIEAENIPQIVVTRLEHEKCTVVLSHVLNQSAHLLIQEFF